MDISSWDEPAGGTPRGTVIILPGRGETPASYQRFGRRLSADAYRVRLVPVDLDDLDTAWDAVGKLVADESLPSPVVLVGADSGAVLATRMARELPVDAVVLAGLAVPGSAPVGSWEEEVEARTACPVHTRVLQGDESFGRGHLNRPLPWDTADVAAPDVPTLVLHGTRDRVTEAGAAVAALRGPGPVRVHLVEGGRHDVLNDLSHRSVAATIVLFLESLRLGADLPPIVRPLVGTGVGSDEGPDEGPGEGPGEGRAA